MDAAARDSVRRRAENRCEYCLLPQEFSVLAHHNRRDPAWRSQHDRQLGTKDPTSRESTLFGPAIPFSEVAQALARVVSIPDFFTTSSESLTVWASLRNCTFLYPPSVPAFSQLNR